MTTHTLFHAINQLSRELTKQLNDALKPHGLYSAQWSVLYVLKTKGSMPQSALCEYLAVEAPPMSRTVQRLIKQGYVQQKPGRDKREKWIDLTEQAEKLYPEWEKTVLDLNDDLLHTLPDADYTLLDSGLNQWLTQLKEGKKT